MPLAWVDFSWVLVQVKRDNVKQNSVVVRLGYHGAVALPSAANSGTED
jgi:hypothetical protein